ncbi:cytochrome P450 87A3 isoform X2 [Capsella rubella]|nr:cytochrome P450 87A3 isoform X2 [Capsella rubella]
MMSWALCIWVSLLVTSITTWVYKWRNPKCSGKLPPGSMGLPLLGETIAFFKPYSNLDIQPFIKERIKKYGPIFKTSFVGIPVIVATDPDFSYFVLNQEGQCFKNWYPDTFTKIFGNQNLATLHGFVYKHLKHMILSLFGHESRKKMLPEIEENVCKKLKLWSTQNSVELKGSTASLILDLTTKKLMGLDQGKYSDKLRDCFAAFNDGLISFPINIPGTAYHKCLEGRERAMKMLRDMLQERRENPRENPSDFFDYVIEELKKEDTLLTEEIALDLMFVLIFTSFETTSYSLTLAIKFLSDDPSILKSLTEEHEAILRNREDANSGLTWKEYKSMTYTLQFINETARLANLAIGIFRKALVDTEYEGYIIPAGWTVMVCPPAIHLNPDIYEDPLVFDPSRWEGSKYTNASKTFMAFGGGMRFCIGTDFSKLQMAVFLHSLVTKYKWEEISGGNIRRTPGLHFPNGYHVKLKKKEI